MLIACWATQGLLYCLNKGCNSKNVSESPNLWPHLGNGVS